jgi:hypothetical protein
MCFQFHNNQKGKIKMKTLRFSILGLFAMLALSSHAQTTDPGWFQTDTSTIPAPVSLDETSAKHI